jgi:pyruvoyl-dependent arginine decarboxylase (PvlArgDC)
LIGHVVMRQELIERAVLVMCSSDQYNAGLLYRRLTLQERAYARGVIEDHKDEMFDELVGKEGSAASLERRRMVRAAVQK